MRHKILSSLALAAILSGCALKNIDEDYGKILLENNASENFAIDERWWLGYEQPRLNELIQAALKNNLDLAKSAIAINRAMAQAGALDANLIPTFNANAVADASRDIKSGNSSWSRSYSASVSLSYEIDLWRKLANAANAAEWEAKASEFDLQATKLTIVNSLVNAYFNALYLNESIALYEAALKNYAKLEAIVRAKFELGKDEQLSLMQIKSSVLSYENRLQNARANLITAQKEIKILLNAEPEISLDLDGLKLSEVKFLGVNFNVPLRAIANRPDLKAAIARIEKGLLNVRASEAEFYPSVTIGASLKGSGERISDASSLKILGGNVAINLPFLNYSKLKSNLRVSEASFESAKIDYLSALNSALNELDAGYKILQSDEALLKNQTAQLENSIATAKIYEAKYAQGKSELKDFLEAQNSEIDARINVLAQRYKTLQDETGIYKSMAGKFSEK